MSAPIGNTCPDIDALIESVKQCIKSVKEVEHFTNNIPSEEELNNITYAVDNINNELYYFEDRLNDIRVSNSTLRV